MDFASKYTNDDNEKILIRKINDIIRKSEKTYSVLYSYFLTPAEQALLSKISEFYGCIEFVGGYPEAERRLCRVCTQEYAVDDGAPIAMYSLKATDPNAIISHRDVLGSLTGLGIKRETIGDINAHNGSAQFFCHNTVSSYIELNLKKTSRYNIVLCRSEFSELEKPKKVKERINVSSMRLDGICAECFGLSRTKAAEFIKKGAVSVNWLMCDNTSKEIKSGDKISFHGKGKIEVVEAVGKSKKGRLFVDIFRYI